MNLAANNRIMIIVPYIIKIFLISYNKKSRGRQFQGFIQRLSDTGFRVDLSAVLLAFL